MKHSILIMLILGTAIFFRTYHLDKLYYVCDEFHEIPTAFKYYQDPNPFSVQEKSAKLSHIYKATLPFYIASSAFHLGYPWRMDSIVWQPRMLSIIFGILSILICYFLGKELFNAQVGLLSAFLLAVSTYHAGFSHLAVTTGDVYASFFYTLSLLLFSKGIKNADQRLLLGSGITAGLACASKFTSFLLLPTSFIFLLMYPKKNYQWDKNIGQKNIPLTLTAFNCAILLFMTMIALRWRGVWFDEKKAQEMLALFFICVVIYFIAVAIIFIRLPKILPYSGLPVIFLNMILFSAIFTLIGSPIHLKPDNFFEIKRWFAENSFSNSPGLHRAFFYIMAVIIFKLGVPFNAFFFAGFIRMIGSLRKAQHLLLIVSITVFIAALSMSKAFVPYYLMPIIPLLIIISSGETINYLNIMRQTKIRIVFIFFIVACLGFQITNALRIAPYFHLDGYKWGKQFIGINKPSFLLVDGLKESILWTEKNIPDNSKVGFLLDLPVFKEAWGGDYRQKMARYIGLNIALCSTNKTITYKYILENDEVSSCDYLIASSIYGKEWLKQDSSLKLMQVVYVSGLEVYRIYSHSL